MLSRPPQPRPRPHPRPGPTKNKTQNKKKQEQNKTQSVSVHCHSGRPLAAKHLFTAFPFRGFTEPLLAFFRFFLLRPSYIGPNYLKLTRHSVGATLCFHGNSWNMESMIFGVNVQHVTIQVVRRGEERRGQTGKISSGSCFRTDSY